MKCQWCNEDAEFKEFQTNILYCGKRCQQQYYALSGKRLREEEKKELSFLDERPKWIPRALWNDIVDLNEKFLSKGPRDLLKLFNTKNEIIKKLEILVAEQDTIFYSMVSRDEINELEKRMAEEKVLFQQEYDSIVFLFERYPKPKIDDKNLVAANTMLLDDIHEGQRAMVRIQEIYNELKRKRDKLLEVIQVDATKGDRMDQLVMIEIMSKFIQDFDSHFELLKPPELIVITEEQEDGMPEVAEGLTRDQKFVFDQMKDLTSRLSNAKSGLSPEQIILLNYIKSTDIVMHFPLKTLLPGLIAKKDLYLRNLFETGVGGGSTNQEDRRGWERKIFMSKTYDNLGAHQKVKYASLNLAQTPHGVRRLFGQYGGSYLIMNSNIKSRSTITPGDSALDFVENRHLATFNNMNHVMFRFGKEKTIDELKEISNAKNFRYVEVQIHGELRFDRDVKKIMINNACREEIEPLLQDYFNVLGRVFEVGYFSDPDPPIDID